MAETLWLVERSYSKDIQNLITLVYATEDGEYYLKKEKALSTPAQADQITAAITVSEDKLEEVNDGDTRERYSREAERMAEKHAPDDTV